MVEENERMRGTKRRNNQFFINRLLWREQQKSSVADPDPRSGAFMTPGSGIQDG